jgi:N-acetylglutamate synthase-like GNAT family acetyltransferase
MLLQPATCQFIELETIKHPLVNRFYKRVYKKGLARKDERVFVLQDKALICSAKLKQLDQQQLLTGVACAPEYRGKGYASLLIKKMMLEQKQPVYCFPYAHLLPFYTRLGFICADVRSVPEIIRARFSAYSKNRDLELLVYHG